MSIYKYVISDDSEEAGNWHIQTVGMPYHIPVTNQNTLVEIITNQILVLGMLKHVHSCGTLFSL